MLLENTLGELTAQSSGSSYFSPVTGHHGIDEAAPEAVFFFEWLLPNGLDIFRLDRQPQGTRGAHVTIVRQFEYRGVEWFTSLLLRL